MDLIFFIALVLICFTNIGIFILNKSRVKLNYWEALFVATVLGYTFFTLVSYFLTQIKLHFLLVPLLFLINFFTIRQVLDFFSKFTLPAKTKLIKILLLFSLGILGQMLIISPSGLSIGGDLVFWSSHGHDSMWHIALAEEYKKGYPLENPIFAGEKLFNYHFFYDIVLSDFNSIFNLSIIDLYFRFLPLMFSILLGGMTYFLVVRISGSFQIGIWATFFMYFAGSFGYIVTYLKNQTMGGESIFWVSQIQSSIGNPPQIVAFVIILTFLNIFHIFLNKNSKQLFLLCTLLLGVLVEFKIYGAIVTLISLFILGMWQIVIERKIIILLLFATSSFLSIILYLPNSLNAGSFLIFEPWWYIRTMVVAPDRLNWIDLELRRQTYIAEGNLKRVIQLEATAFLIFLFGNLGMRFLGFYTLALSLKNALRNSFNLYLILMCLTSFVFPLLFLQKGVAGNSIQFFQYFLLIFSIFAAVSVSKIMDKIKKNSVKIFLGIVIIILSIPTQIGLIYNFYSNLPLARIDKKELSALNFFKKTPTDTVILTAPFNKNVKSSDLIPPIWLWSDTSYVTALSGRRTYIADEEQINILGYNLEERIAFQRNIFEENTPEQVKQNLLSRKIDYLYFPKILEPKVDLSEANLKKVFSNSEIEIWQVSKN